MNINKTRLQSRAYDYNVYILKNYSDKAYKLSLHNVLRNCGVEIDNNVNLDRSRKNKNDKKSLESLSRAKNRIFEYGLCNEWKYFVTFTIDPKKYDRFDLKSYYKDFTQFLKNYNKKHNIKIKYLIIPERHQDGAWHLHGLLNDLPIDHLEMNHFGYFDWMPYSKKFGYISIDFIKDQSKVSSYITKYVSKDLAKSVNEYNAKMYYCSQGLKRAEIVKKGSIAGTIETFFDFENEYVKLKWLNNNEFNVFKDLIE